MADASADDTTGDNLAPHGDSWYAGDDGAARRSAHGELHIGDFSAAAGSGVDAGVTADIDGDPRPIPAGTLPDLGADEIRQHRVYLPLLLKSHP